MSVNRIASYFSYDASTEVENLPGFTTNPFLQSLTAWQIELYKAAFRQAEKDARKDAEDWPGLEFEI